MPTKTKWETKGENSYGDPIHYFASSIAEWKTATDLVRLIEHMQSSIYPFNVYRVNLPAEAAYKIQGFAPALPEDQVDWIAFFEIKE